MSVRPKDIINEERICETLKKTEGAYKKTILDIFKRAKELKGLNLEEVGLLVNNLNDPDAIKELFDIAGWVKNKIYGERLVLFAPLYISNFCIDDCEYCNFRIKNKELKRKKLTLREIEKQTKFLIDMGHRRVLVVCGEDPLNSSVDYVIEAIEKIYSIKTKKGNICRVNVNIGATTEENYRKLKIVKIGTYQLFQETYHYQTYKRLHHGAKSDYTRRITAHNLAFEAGLDDVGLGVLFGLYDWKFEILALISHARYLEKKFKVGPRSISFPRFRPAPVITYKPVFPVSDSDFLKIIAILRLALPYTELIISTRETPQIRKSAFQIGVSQTSAGSVPSVGGYGKDCEETRSQFHVSIYEERPLKEIMLDILDDKLLPSFCTACYRLGRTGEAFMDFSKKGAISHFCRLNSILTFAEFLEDFAEDGLYKKGYEAISIYLDKIEGLNSRQNVIGRLNRIKEGKRGLYF